MNNETKIKNETLRNNRFDVVANNVYMQNFNDTKPNSAFIRNYGSADLYVSTRSNPSLTDYDQVIAGGSLISLVKLQPFDRLYFFSTGNCPVTVESFEVENIRPADIPETQQIVFINTAPVNLGNVNQILSPLPAGANVIGGVNVSNTPTVNDEAYTPMMVTVPAGGSGITIKASAGKVASVITTLTALKLRDGTTEVYQCLANNVSLVKPIQFNTSINLLSATGGTAYVAFK